jgi:hypothetical protein
MFFACMFFAVGWSIFFALYWAGQVLNQLYLIINFIMFFLGIRDQFCGGAAALWRSPLRFGRVEEAVLKLC